MLEVKENADCKVRDYLKYIECPWTIRIIMNVREWPHFYHTSIEGCIWAARPVEASGKCKVACPPLPTIYFQSLPVCLSVSRWLERSYDHLFALQEISPSENQEFLRDTVCFPISFLRLWTSLSILSKRRSVISFSFTNFWDIILSISRFAGWPSSPVVIPLYWTGPFGITRSSIVMPRSA